MYLTYANIIINTENSNTFARVLLSRISERSFVKIKPFDLEASTLPFSHCAEFCIVHTKGSKIAQSLTCADPERFVRGGPDLTFLF